MRLYIQLFIYRTNHVFNDIYLIYWNILERCSDIFESHMATQLIITTSRRSNENVNRLLWTMTKILAAWENDLETHCSSAKVATSMCDQLTLLASWNIPVYPSSKCVILGKFRSGHLLFSCLTHWPLGYLDKTLKIKFSNLFDRLISSDFI